MANLPTPQPAPDEAAPLPPLARGQCVFGNTFDFLRDTSRLLLDSYRELGPVFRLRALWLKYTVIGGFEARDFIRQGLDEKYLTREAIFAEVGRQLGSADFVLGQSGENISASADSFPSPTPARSPRPGSPISSKWCEPTPATGSRVR